MNKVKQKITFGKISKTFQVSNEKHSSDNEPHVDKSEKSQEISSGFGTFGVASKTDKLDEVSEQITKVMGFSDFGQKKAKKFDVQEMVQLALENKNNIIPPKQNDDIGEADSNSEGEIGPAIPEEFKISDQISVPKKNTEKKEIVKSNENE